MTDKANIVEIFSSIQGEGPFVGYKQLFIRFAGCNLKCNYCDTEYAKQYSKSYSVEELCNIVENNKICHSVSLTGGEPLLHCDFLTKFLPKCNKKTYLETNATLYKELENVINYIDYVAADIKLPSCTGMKECWKEHELFFKIAEKKYLFAKIVFDENIKDNEIQKCCELGKKYNIELILQPKMNGNILELDTNFIEKIYDMFLNKYNNVRVIPQTHKFINVR